ncbi:MAG: hypothetical protein HRU01_04130 [Myxococcales bacterium]|nr:hypothetical protein [Myxococcales bacterium]
MTASVARVNGLDSSEDSREVAIVAGLLVIQLPNIVQVPAVELGGEERLRFLPVAIFTFVDIRHSFTDGVVWKLGDRQVRDDLLSHLPGR